MRRIAIPRQRVCLLLLWQARLLAQDKPVELRFSHWVPPGHPMHPAVEAWAESIKQGLERHDHDQDFPGAAARQGVRSLQHGEGRHRRHRACESGLRARPLPDHGRCRNCPSSSPTPRQGSAALDAWYRKYADKEMKDVKYCLTFAHDPATFHTTNKKVDGAGRREGHEDPARQRHDQPLHLAARRHQRAGLGAGIARRSRKGRGRRHHLPVGLDRAVRHRQGDEISPRRPALRHRADLRDEQGQVRRRCRRRSAR